MAVDPADVLSRVGIDAGAAVTVDDVPHNGWLTPGIWIVHDAEQKVVVKLLRAEREQHSDAWARHWTAGSHDLQRWNFWQREALVYRHALARLFEPAGIESPDVLRVSETASDAVLLLQFVDGVPAEQWAIADYAEAAARLGRAQGQFVTGTPLPDHPWLSRRFLREYSTEKPVDWSLLGREEAWEQPLVRSNFPRELREEASWLHAARWRLLAVAEALPRTLCHLDFWTKNLIRKDGGAVVLVDWGFAGDGALGEDIGNLVPDAAFDHFVPADSLADLEHAAVGAYVTGLRDAGWSGDRRLVELAVAASAVKYDWLTPHMLAAAARDEQRRYGGGAVDADYLFRERGLALLHNARAARRALDLAAATGVG